MRDKSDKSTEKSINKIITIRSENEILTKQGLPYFLGVIGDYP
jgi:hypothetical protein